MIDIGRARGEEGAGETGNAIGIKVSGRTGIVCLGRILGFDAADTAHRKHSGKRCARKKTDGKSLPH
jgi:hypothetical protein